MKRGVNFGMDNAQAARLNGYLDGLATTVSSRHYVDAVLDYTVETLADKFGMDADLAAMHFPERFSHVYEWGDSWGDDSRVGLPQWRLWRVGTLGQGNTRAVSFYFTPSGKPSPIHPSLLSDGEGRGVNEGVHIFVWKAPIMEYGLTVSISPELAKKLVFWDDEEEKIVFTEKTIETRPGLDHHGEYNHVGVFSGFFVNWWQRQAPEKFDEELRPRIERDLVDQYGMRAAVGKRRGSKQVNVQLQGRAEFNEGKRAAKESYRNKARQYLAEAARRRLDLYGY